MTPLNRSNRSARVALSALLVGSVLAVSACASASPDTAPEPAGPVTITFSSYNYGTAGAAGTGTQALLDRFAELHPTITVVPEAVPVADVLSKTKAAVASGTAPDVVQLGYSKMAEAFATLPIKSLQEIAGDEWTDHIAGIAPGLVETGTSDGTIKALPYTVSIPTIFYNADLLGAAGLGQNVPLETISDVTSAAEAIVANGHNGVYFGLVDSGKSDYLTQSVINSAGGHTVAADGTVTLDSPKPSAGSRRSKT